VLIWLNLCSAERISACVRIVTVTQTAKVASIIMQKTTHEGIAKSRRRAETRGKAVSPAV
jgi:hypothetical protein